jgi:hypothetical protein
MSKETARENRTAAPVQADPVITPVIMKSMPGQNTGRDHHRNAVPRFFPACSHLAFVIPIPA